MIRHLTEYEMDQSNCKAKQELFSALVTEFKMCSWAFPNALMFIRIEIHVTNGLSLLQLYSEISLTEYCTILEADYVEFTYQLDQSNCTYLHDYDVIFSTWFYQN